MAEQSFEENLAEQVITASNQNNNKFDISITPGFVYATEHVKYVSWERILAVHCSIIHVCISVLA